MAQYTKGNHAEIPDPTPVEMPVGYEHPEPLESIIARMIRAESERMDREGNDTFEESDDFDCDDDSEIVSPYQMTNMQEEFVHEPAPKRGTKNGVERQDKSHPERTLSEAEENGILEQAEKIRQRRNKPTQGQAEQAVKPAPQVEAQ